MSTPSWVILLGAALSTSSSLIFIATVKWRDRQWAVVMEGLKTAKHGETVAKICRTCAPNAKIARGSTVYACPHGGVIPALVSV